MREGLLVVRKVSGIETMQSSITIFCRSFLWKVHRKTSGVFTRRILEEKVPHYYSGFRYFQDRPKSTKFYS